MSLAQVLSAYLMLNVLIFLAFSGLAFFCYLARKSKRSLLAKTELELHYIAMIFLIVITLVQPFFPKNEIFQPAVKVWSSPSLDTFYDHYGLDKGGYLTVPTLNSVSAVEADKVSTLWLMLGLGLLIAGGFLLGRDLKNLLSIKKNSYLLKKIGRCRIYANDSICVPFSYWQPGQANVVIPSSLAISRHDYKMAVTHELQHHRQGDTQWVYVMWALRLVCVLNPIVHLWNRWISEVQEFACDETLVDQNKVESQAYARCLVEVAQSAINQKYVPVCATGLTFLVDGNILKRRIQKMFAQKNIKLGRSIPFAFSVVMAALMVTTAYASQGWVQDRRVTMAQAQELAKKSEGKDGFKIVVNEKVLKQLNRYIGTPEGRAFMRESLERMKKYLPMIESQIKSYRVPMELLAIPIIESGYRNLEEDNKEGHGAGLWMFIKSTARVYGMNPDANPDERNNEVQETDAAMRYLLSNYLEFQDWHLASLAYNIGEDNVRQAIRKTGSWDAWVLIKNKYENDRDYLPKLMAAVIIMKNPDSVK